MQAVLARFAALSASAITLIQRGKRNPEQVSALLLAMQQFKDGNLKGYKGEMPDPRLSFLSLRIQHADLSSRTINKLYKDYGVRYVGEIYRVPRPKSKGVKWGEEVNILLEQNDLSWDTSPFEYGWTPPYWGEDFNYRLSRALYPDSEERIDYHAQAKHRSRFVDEITDLWERECFYAGQYLRQLEGDDGRIDLERHTLKYVSHLKIPHHGAWVPLVWSAPDSVPSQVTKYQEWVLLQRAELTSRVRKEFSTFKDHGVLDLYRNTRSGFHSALKEGHCGLAATLMQDPDVRDSPFESPWGFKHVCEDLGLPIEVLRADAEEIARTYEVPQTLGFYK